MKKSLSTLLLSLFLLPTLTLAVGLGSVRNYSFLNERLNAEIPVLSIQQKTGMNVSLASNEEFVKRGITREAILNDLTLSVIEKNGRSYIKIGSINRITAPYLNFVLKLDTSEGILLREYTIFLDPRTSVNQVPKVQPTAHQVKKAKITQPIAQKATPKATISKAKPVAKPAPKVPSKPTKSSQANNPGVKGIKGWVYGPVKEGETIWRIAFNTRPSSTIPVDTFINVLKKVNPQAFKDGQLKKGVKLLIPKVKGFPSQKKN